MTRCRHGRREHECPTCTTETLVLDLTHAVEWLAASLLPGTHTIPPLMHYEDKRTQEQREQARLEREQRVDIAPGESPAPFNMNVADLLSEVLAEVDDLAERAADDAEAGLRGWAGAWAQDLPPLRLAPATSAFADPLPYLELLGDLIRHIPNPDLIEHIAERCHALVTRANAVLGLIFDGQLLDALCPWCRGVTDHHPIGGRRTLRVRMSHDDDPRALIVCEGGHCNPGDQSGIQWKHLPAWDLLNEGDWLSKCIKVRDDAATCRCGRPVLRTGKAGRPALHCSEDCRRAADAERQRLARAC